MRIAEDQAVRLGEFLAQLHTLGLGHGLQNIERRLDDFADVGLFGIDTDLAAGDGAQVEQVIHQMGEVSCIAGDGLPCGLGLGGIEPSELHQARPAQDRVERRPQLMTERLQEFVLQPARTLGLEACGALEFELGPQLIEGLIHGTAAPVQICTF